MFEMIYLELYFKKPSKRTKKVMCEAVMSESKKINSEFIRNAENQIINITGHEYCKVVNSGNSAIFTVMSLFADMVLIPDQGGWIGFKSIAEFLGIKTVEVPTKLGVINCEVLEDYITKFNPEAFFITSLAGYIAEQPIKEIYEVCDDKNVILVEDASGGIGDPKNNLGNGNHAHIIIASTGSPKIVNVGNGGLISTNDNEIFKKSKNILRIVKADPITCAGISEEIKNAPSIISKTMKSCELIKKELYSSIHKSKRGITVGLITDEPRRIGYELRNRLNVEGRSIITICPRYERLMINAVCLEIKNLDLNCLNNKTLNLLIQTVQEVIE